MPTSVRLPEKSKPRVTVGRKATDRRWDGDGWVAEAKQMTFPKQHLGTSGCEFQMRDPVGIEGGIRPTVL